MSAASLYFLARSEGCCRLSARKRNCFSKARWTFRGASLRASMARSDKATFMAQVVLRLAVFRFLISFRRNLMASPAVSNGPWCGPLRASASRAFNEGPLLRGILVVRGRQFGNDGDHTAGRLELQHIPRLKAGPLPDRSRQSDGAGFGFDSDGHRRTDLLLCGQYSGRGATGGDRGRRTGGRDFRSGPGPSPDGPRCGTGGGWIGLRAG